MASAGRGYCPVCSREVSVKADGAAGHHGQQKKGLTTRGKVAYGDRCHGSGMRVKRFVGAKLDCRWREVEDEAQESE